MRYVACLLNSVKSTPVNIGGKFKKFSLSFKKNLSKKVDTNSSQTKKIISTLVVLIVYFSIIIDSSVNTIILESITPLNITWLPNTFILASMPFSILLAGWSDFHCRRKTLILALLFTTTSCGLIILYNLSGYNWLVYVSIVLKATGGNVVPIALAMLADVTNKKSFRTCLAIAICAISVGFWGPIYIRAENTANVELVEYGFICASTITILTILFVKDTVFDNVKFHRNTANIRHFFSFIKREQLLVGLLLIVPIVGTALLGFTISETSYYQFLLRGELLQKTEYYSFNSLVLAIGYYLGTALLILLGFKSIEDIICIKIGMYTSFLSLLIFCLMSYLNFQYIYIFPLILFSVGVALITPTLFAAILKVRESEDQGKIFGLLDSADSFATYLSSIIIKKTSLASHFLSGIITLKLFSISCIFYIIFIKIYKKEKRINNLRIIL
jgi:MFS family permease